MYCLSLKQNIISLFRISATGLSPGSLFSYLRTFGTSPTLRNSSKHPRHFTSICASWFSHAPAHLRSLGTPPFDFPALQHISGTPALRRSRLSPTFPRSGAPPAHLRRSRRRRFQALTGVYQSTSGPILGASLWCWASALAFGLHLRTFYSPSGRISAESCPYLLHFSEFSRRSFPTPFGGSQSYPEKTVLTVSVDQVSPLYSLRPFTQALVVIDFGALHDLATLYRRRQKEALRFCP